MSEVDADGALTLELDAIIRLPRSTSVVKYSFALAPVEVDRVDVLEAKLSDQGEAIQRIEKEREAAPAFVQLEAEMKDGRSNLIWEEAKTDFFLSNGEDGFVAVCRPGVYSIGAVVSTVLRVGAEWC